MAKSVAGEAVAFLLVRVRQGTLKIESTPENLAAKTQILQEANRFINQNFTMAWCRAQEIRLARLIMAISVFHGTYGEENENVELQGQNIKEDVPELESPPEIPKSKSSPIVKQQEVKKATPPARQITSPKIKKKVTSKKKNSDSEEWDME